jgi:hypothetical protein
VNRPMGDGAGHSGYGLVPVLARVRRLDADLALAVAFDHGSHLALLPARDAGQLVRGVLDRGAEIAGARAVAACLTFDADPGLALVRARDAASEDGGDCAVADTPDLLALLLNLIEALRNHPDRNAMKAVRGTPAARVARWVVRACVRFLPPGHRQRYITRYAAGMA